MYDSYKRHKAIEKIVVRGKARKYWRFRSDNWYGGIVTADVVGCGLICKPCWAKSAVLLPAKIGVFYTPSEVVEIFIKTAVEHGFKQLRISGGEPTIGKQHLLKILDLLQHQGFLFILETNGILIGAEPDYARDLSKFQHLHVRVSLKGYNEEEFNKLTGARPQDFNLQLKALENLKRADVRCHPAVMPFQVHTKSALKQLAEKLKELNIETVGVEFEKLFRYRGKQT